jgi:hypothetical protein
MKKVIGILLATILITSCGEFSNPSGNENLPSSRCFMTCNHPIIRLSDGTFSCIGYSNATMCEGWEEYLEYPTPKAD